MDLHTRVRERLARAEQAHLLHFYDQLSPGSQRALLEQIDSLDLEALPGLVREYVLHKPEYKVPRTLEPVRAYPLDAESKSRPWDREAMRRAGESLLRAGRVGAFVVAGGQGSRLGFDGPKGCFPVGAVSRRPLFQFFAEGILASQRRYCPRGVVIPWYVMTSPLNHDATVRFFDEHRYFGLAREQVMFFQQGVMPSLDIRTGKVLLAALDEVATNPDGHGGSIRALHASGALDDMRSRGIEQLSYFQVDNPLVRVIDPVFLGLHIAAPDSSGEMSSKMVSKASPEEKVGVFCLADGRTGVLEYSDMPAELQQRRNADGSLTYNAGNIAVHVLSVEFARRLATDAGFALPCHRAEKKVACIDVSTGERIEPLENNAVKLEKFIFDALSLAESSIVMETDRVEEFAPVKNASGVDSPESCARIQTERAARWLESAGVRIPRRSGGEPDCVLEVSPLTALEARDLRESVLPSHIEREARVCL